MSKQDNLVIWSEVEKTNPAHTKEFNRGGGFKGTSINATYLARRATEIFGPMGLGWGLEIVDEAIMEGAPLDANGTYEKIHKVRVKLWYKHGEERGEVIQFGQTTFVGRNRNGLFTDEEAPKKSLTDAMTKCLSLLGFSADVFLGLYDDNKYVAEVTQEFERKERSAERLTDVLARIKGADKEGLAAARDWAKKNIKDDGELEEVAKAIAARDAQLAKLLASDGKQDEAEAPEKPKAKARGKTKQAEEATNADKKADEAEKPAKENGERAHTAVAHILKRVENADKTGIKMARDWANKNIKDADDLKLVLKAIKKREAALAEASSEVEAVA